MNLDTMDIAVVDSANRFVRWSNRREVHHEQLIHRSVHIAVFRSDGSLLVQRRHSEKQTYAGYWDMSCSGHVERPDYPGGPDEALEHVFLQVAQRELFEELGIRPELTFLSEFGPLPGVHYEYFRFFGAVSDGPYTLQKDEVSEVRSVSLQELEAFFASDELITPSLVYLARWLAQHKHLGSSSLS